MRGTHLEVAAGAVRIHVYNRGMDDHDLAVVDAHGQCCTRVPLVLGRRCRARRRRRGRARCKLFCSLFAGTPDSHEAKGMVFDLTAR